MKLIVEINLDNAAFDETVEAARIIRKVADRVDGCDYRATNGDQWNLFDSNGNKVGEAKVVEDQDQP